ncbi:MAG: glutathione S-transferase family protein [Pseudomonadota bacterium]
MHHADPVTLQGVHGSPYTRKALAVLRYRRIPYRFVIGQPGNPISWGHVDHEKLPVPKVPLLPTFYFDDDEGTLQAVTDTTPIIRRLERIYTGRSVLPPDPLMNLLNYILEDYADEWLTRCMFHYRWSYSDDIDKASTTLPYYPMMNLDDETGLQMKAVFAERQISRLHVVGSNDVTGPVIEESYERFLSILNSHLKSGHQFMLGNRPSSSDFAAVGQLTSLAHFDPTPARVTLDIAPRVYAWVERNEDLCGVDVTDDDWLQPDELPDTLLQMLSEVARTHMPQLLANARALLAGERLFETEIDGKTWKQPSFSYQGKCLQWIREEHGSLSPQQQKRSLDILESVGLSDLITASVSP